MAYPTYSVVLKYYINGILMDGWIEIVDSTSKSGATRKANNLVSQACGKIDKKTQVDNYEYWKVEV